MIGRLAPWRRRLRRVIPLLVLACVMTCTIPRAWAQGSAATLRPGSLSLVQVTPDNRVILVYMAPDGSLVPARVLTTSGSVVAADKLAESSVVWVTVDDSGAARPLQTSGAGDLVPARLDGQGKPLLPGSAPASGVFAAQIGVDGRLHVLLQRIDQPLPKVAVRDDKSLALAETDEAAAPLGIKLGGFFTVDNSGSRATGIYRGNALIRAEELWGLGHSAQLFVASSLHDPNALIFGEGSYSVPVQGLVEAVPDRLGIAASYSRVNYETLPPGQAAVDKFAIRSRTYTASYLQNLALSESEGRAVSHALTYGLMNDKVWTQDHGFSQDDLSSIVRMPASIRYDFKFYDETFGLLTVAPTYVRNIPLGAAGEGDDYRNDRQGADPRYDKITLEAGHTLDFVSGWSTLARTFGQVTDEPLIQSEAISLGGLTSVRGLEFAKTVGEYGAIGQLEVLAPDLLSKPYSIRPSVFLDAGWVKKDGDQPGTANSDSAVGTGIGVRLAAPGGLFANIYGGWLVGGTVIDRYADDDGRFQLYVNAGVNF